MSEKSTNQATFDYSDKTYANMISYADLVWQQNVVRSDVVTAQQVAEEIIEIHKELNILIYWLANPYNITTPDKFAYIIQAYVYEFNNMARFLDNLYISTEQSKNIVSMLNDVKKILDVTHSYYNHFLNKKSKTVRFNDQFQDINIFQIYPSQAIFNIPLELVNNI